MEENLKECNCDCSADAMLKKLDAEEAEQKAELKKRNGKDHSCLDHMHSIHDVPCYFYKYLDVIDRVKFNEKRAALIESYNRNLTHALVELFEEFSPLISDRWNKRELREQIGDMYKKINQAPRFDLENMDMNELWSIHAWITGEMKKREPKEGE